MKVYIAGPMRGHPDWNFAAFDMVREAWTKAGHEVFCPAQLFRAMPYPKHDDTVTTDRRHLEHVIQSDILCLMHADAIALLPGWQNSRGATVELSVAQFLGLEVYDAVTMDLTAPVLVPWREVDRLHRGIMASCKPRGEGHSY